MAKFIVYSSETVLYETIIEAPTEAEAFLRFSLEEVGDEVDRVGFQTDGVREVPEDETT
tara:strand:- start:13951 stop:14127 length:177 start_codon:yes stop_codon:yes gene_type:complete